MGYRTTMWASMRIRVRPMTDADDNSGCVAPADRLREAQKQLRIAADKHDGLEHECRDLAGRVGELRARIKTVQALESGRGQE
jgi:hypothetical protein